MRQPVAPTGCPSEMPEPWTLTRSRPSGSCHSRRTASAWAANASLSSIRSMSASVSPARASALAVEGTGPIPIVAGGTPATAQATRRPSGRRPSSAALSGWVITHTAAPSFWPLALPAVTVASGSLLPMIGFRLASRSSGRVGARVLVALDHRLLAAAAAHGDGDDLLREGAVLARGDRALV